MKKLMRMLPLLGLVLAAVFAFAFTNPMDTNQTYYAWDDQAEKVVSVNQTTQYNCDENITVHCLYLDPELMDPATPEQEGKFQLISP